MIEKDDQFGRREFREIFGDLRRRFARELCLKGPTIAGDEDADCCFKISDGGDLTVRLCRVVKQSKFFEYSEYKSTSSFENPGEGPGISSRPTEYCLDSRDRGFLFVTRYDEIRAWLDSGASEETLRGVLRGLGLPNCWADSRSSDLSRAEMTYVLVDYPTTLNLVRLVKPTFIEGGENNLFLVRIGNEEDRWGRTLDTDEPDCVGFREAVHCPAGNVLVEYEEFKVRMSPEPDFKAIVEAMRI
jgi:hypothetical protein